MIHKLRHTLEKEFGEIFHFVLFKDPGHTGSMFVMHVETETVVIQDKGVLTPCEVQEILSQVFANLMKDNR